MDFQTSSQLFDFLKKNPILQQFKSGIEKIDYALNNVISLDRLCQMFASEVEKEKGKSAKNFPKAIKCLSFGNSLFPYRELKFNLCLFLYNEVYSRY